MELLLLWSVALGDTMLCAQHISCEHILPEAKWAGKGSDGRFMGAFQDSLSNAVDAAGFGGGFVLCGANFIWPSVSQGHLSGRIYHICNVAKRLWSNFVVTLDSGQPANEFIRDAHTTSVSPQVASRASLGELLDRRRKDAGGLRAFMGHLSSTCIMAYG